MNRIIERLARHRLASGLARCCGGGPARAETRRGASPAATRVTSGIALTFATVMLTHGLLNHSAVWAADDAPDEKSSWTVDHRYAPPWWQTSICLPDDWQKTLLGKQGCLLYDFG